MAGMRTLMKLLNRLLAVRVTLVVWRVLGRLLRWLR